MWGGGVTTISPFFRWKFLLGKNEVIFRRVLGEAEELLGVGELLSFSVLITMFPMWLSRTYTSCGRPATKSVHLIMTALYTEEEPSPLLDSDINLRTVCGPTNEGRNFLYLQQRGYSIIARDKL